jgi:hypothetical protein
MQRGAASEGNRDRGQAADESEEPETKNGPVERDAR